MGFEGDYTEEQVERLKIINELTRETDIAFAQDAKGIVMPRTANQLPPAQKEALNKLIAAGLVRLDEDKRHVHTFPYEHLEQQVYAYNGVNEAELEGRIAPVKQEVVK